MRTGGFAGRVRGALKLLNCKAGVSNAALAEALDLVFDADKRPMYNAVRDMIRSGEVVRIAPGVHRYVGRPDPYEKQKVMWRLLRNRWRSGESTRVADMVELAGVSKNYAKEFFQRLARAGIVRRNGPHNNQPASYTLLKETPEMPRDIEKAERLQRLREVKSLANEALDAIQESLDIAVAALAAIEEE